MSKATLNQSQELLKLVAQSGIDRRQLQVLLQSGRFSVLLREFMEEPAHPEPTITPISFARNYGQTLVQARDAMKLDGYVEQDVNDTNFPPEGREGDREYVLVCFHRDIDDHEDEDPEKSELLRELDKLGLRPEGPMELCFVGADERTRDLQREFPIVARRQVWRDPHGYVLCPILFEDGHGRGLFNVQNGWDVDDRFLASRK